MCRLKSNEIPDAHVADRPSIENACILHHLVYR
jgi:hypothetical protein